MSLQLLPPLPGFLRPLLLLPALHTRVAETLNDWIRGRDNQLFGPLEQAVTAVVLVSLAMQPGTLSSAQTRQQPLSIPVQPPSRSNGTLSSPTPASSASSLATDLTELRQTLQDILPSPMTFLMILMILNAAILLLPPNLRARLKASWDLFWPPWQSRSSVDGGETARPEGERARQSESERARDVKQMGDAEKERIRAKLKERELAKQQAEKLESEKEKESGSRIAEEDKEKLRAKQKAGMEKASRATAGAGMSSEEKEKMRAKMKERERLKAREAAEKSSSPKSHPAEEPRSKETPRDKIPSSKPSGEERDKLAISSSAPVTETAPLSQSERARKAKRESAEVAPQPGTKDKGKSRMPGERPSDSTSTATNPTLSVSERSSKDVPRSSTNSTTSTASTSVTTGSTSDPSTSSEAEEDALMAGDYRPLKSLLKKSKKKERQKKNIHHNYFMTMRGHRPHLVPFPHGFHPRPTAIRHSLWFNNVPSNADHIMASPAIAKIPEGDDDGRGKQKKVKEVNEVKSGGASDIDKEKEKVRLAKDKEMEKGRETNKSKREDKPKSTSGEKEKEKVTYEDKEKAREREKAKMRAEAEAKAKAKAKAAEAQPIPATSTSRSQETTLDPRLQRATFVAQGMLCCLLYLVNQQLALLLLAFFVYQHIQQTSQASKQTSPGGRREAVRSSAPSTSRQDGAGQMPPAMQEKLDQATGSPKITVNTGSIEAKQVQSSSGPPAPPLKQRDTAPDSKAAEEEPSPDTSHQSRSRTPRTLADLTPEQRERYLKALAARKSKTKASTTPQSKPPDSPKSSKESIRLEDLTDEQREDYLKARADRKEKERQKAREAENMSGLTHEEKESLTPGSMTPISSQSPASPTSQTI